MARELEGSVIITGGTGGLGAHAARNLAKAHPEYLIILASRTDTHCVAAQINAKLHQSNAIFLPINLSDINNVREFARDWGTTGSKGRPPRPPIRALLLNAALLIPGPVQKTADGIEKTFAIAHVGHVALFHLLSPYFSPYGCRVVVTCSGTHDPAQKTHMPDAVYTSAEQLARPSSPAALRVPGLQRYPNAKLCNILWTYALHRRLENNNDIGTSSSIDGESTPSSSTPALTNISGKNITVNAIDPGLMPGTGLGREVPWIVRMIWIHIFPHVIPLARILMTPNIHTAEESGRALARLAVGPDVEGVSGKYFEGLREIRSSVASYDQNRQEDLWRWTVGYLFGGGGNVDRVVEKEKQK